MQRLVQESATELRAVRGALLRSLHEEPPGHQARVDSKPAMVGGAPWDLVHWYRLEVTSVAGSEFAEILSRLSSLAEQEPRTGFAKFVREWRRAEEDSTE